MIEKSDFESRIKVGPDCWEWVGTRDSYGYGVIKTDGKMMKAHRLAVFFATGKMPVLFVCHKCNNPGCVRPDHLYEGTNADNMRDARAAGAWRPGEYQATKTKCVRGHSLSGSNLLMLPGNDGRGPRRACRSCRTLRRDPAWRKRHGFDSLVLVKQIWSKPTMKLRPKAIHLGHLAALVLMAMLSGCSPRLICRDALTMDDNGRLVPLQICERKECFIEGHSVPCPENGMTIFKHGGSR